MRKVLLAEGGFVHQGGFPEYSYIQVMQYKVVCVKEFRGVRSNGTVCNIKLPVVDENIDGFGVHSLILAELPYRSGYNSEHFRPLEPGDMLWESLEELMGSPAELELIGAPAGGVDEF